MIRKTLLISGLATTALTATPGFAQDIETMPLADFDATEIEGAWSADQMQDADVFGEDGEHVGYVQNIILGTDDSVERLVVETDNWLDIGDRVISVPWDNVELTPDSEGIRAPLDESEMDNFSIFGDDESTDTGPRAYRAEEILGETVNTEGEVGYGYVTDLIFNEAGDLESVLVSVDVGFAGADYGDGYYAYPYYGYDAGYDPYEAGYTLPYSEDEVRSYEPTELDLDKNI